MYCCCMETLDKNEDIKEKIFESLIPVKVENCPRAVHNTQFYKSPDAPTALGLFVFCSLKNTNLKAIKRCCFFDAWFVAQLSHKKVVVKCVNSPLNGRPTARRLKQDSVIGLTLSHKYPYILG